MKYLAIILLFVATHFVAAEDDPSEAIVDYETWLTDNGPNLSVLYNLGNAYYKSEDYGNAILSYEKALAIKPTDRKTRANLNLTRKAAGLENVRINRYGLLGALAYNRWARQLLFAAFLILLTLLIPKLKKMQAHLKPIRITRYIAIVFLLLAIAALIARRPELKRAIAVAKETKVRLSPFTTAEPVKSLVPGEMVQVIDEHKDFYQLESGWVSKQEVKKIYE